MVTTAVWRDRNWVTGWTGIYLFSRIARQTLRSTQPPIQAPRFLSGGKSAGAFKLTTHLHLVPRLRINGAVPLFTMYVCMAWRGTALPLYGGTVIL